MRLFVSAEEYEAVISTTSPSFFSSIQAASISIPVANSARCLSAWWTMDLSPDGLWKTSTKQRVLSLLMVAVHVFHGTLNPLSSRSIVESCVLRILLYGTETWILNTTLLKKLKSFQAA